MSIGDFNKQCGVLMCFVCVLLESDISLTRAIHSNVEIYILISWKNTANLDTVLSVPELN